MTVGSGILSGLVGWDVGALFGSDALSDADFVYDHETYELQTISFNTGTGGLNVTFDAAGSGSIADAAVREESGLPWAETAPATGPIATRCRVGL